MGIILKFLSDGKIRDIKRAVTSKYWSNFLETIKILLVNCEINLILTWSADCLISYVTWATNLQ